MHLPRMSKGMVICWAVGLCLLFAGCGGGGNVSVDSAPDVTIQSAKREQVSLASSAASTAPRPATYTLQYSGATLYDIDTSHCTYNVYGQLVCPAIGNVTATIIFKDANVFDPNAAIAVVSATMQAAGNTLTWPGNSNPDGNDLKCFVPSDTSKKPYCYGGLISPSGDLHMTMNIWASGYVYGGIPNDSVTYNPPASSGNTPISGSTNAPGTVTYSATYGESKNLGACACDSAEGNLPSGNGAVPDDPSAAAGSGGSGSFASINSGTGNLYVTQNDYTGAPHTRLSFTRFYNSQDTRPGPVGYGWRTEWHRSLDASLTSGTATTSRGDGRTALFKRSGSGTWDAEPDALVSLKVLLNGSGVQIGWQLVLADDSIETYSLSGALQSVVTRSGQKTTLAYDAGGNLATVTGPFGHRLSFTYSGGVLGTMTAPDGGVYRYAYDSSGNLASVVYPDNTTKRYKYTMSGAVVGGIDPRHLLSGITDELGNTYATYSYDSYGNATFISRGNYYIDYYGYHFLLGSTIVYNADGSASVTTPNGFSHTTNFTTKFNQVKPILASGTPYLHTGGAAFAYGPNGGLSSITDFNGNVATLAYDSRNNILSRTEASGTAIARTVTTSWHTTYRLPTQVVYPTETIQLAYDASGNLASRSRKVGAQARTWQYTYSAAGQVTSSSDPKGQTTSFVYDSSGNLTSVTDALGHVTTLPEYDANGRPAKIIDPNGLITTITYDSRGRTTRTNVGGLITVYSYDAAGNLVGTTKPDGSKLATTYDSAHRLTSVTDSLGNSVTYTLDYEGNRTKTTVSDSKGTLNRVFSLEYDFAGRVTKITGAAGQVTSLTRDNNGNILSVTDPLARVTRSVYDALNRRTSTTDARGGVTAFAYDAADRMVNVTDPRSLTTTYSHNGFGDLLQTVSPDSGTTTRTVDANGNLVTSTDARGLTNSRAYDALDRPTSITYPGGHLTYQYDSGTNGIGRLAAVSGNSDNTTFTYDLLGRLVSKQQTVNGTTLNQSYGFDSGGRLASMTYPSGLTVGYGDDAAGQVSSVSVNGAAFLSGIAHEPFGPAKGWTWAGQSYARPHDTDGRVTSFPLGPTTRALSYDLASRITRYADTGGATQAFGYDELDRLTSFNSASLSQSYGYDADGNRTSLTAGGVTSAYGIAGSSNQLQSRTNPAVSYVYDAAGNLTSTGNQSYSFDALGRMTGSLVGSSRSAGRTLYYVNGLGQRMQKAGPAGTTTFLYGDGSQLLGEYAGASSQETIYLDGMPVGVMNNGTALRIFADQLGAPRVISDASGVVKWTWDGEPFGNVAPTSTITFNQRFPGQYADAETGLYFNHARYYDPKTGRYTQSDPIGLKGGLNKYTFVRSTPTNIGDALGLCPQGDITCFLAESRAFGSDSVWAAPDTYSPGITAGDLAEGLDTASSLTALTGGIISFSNPLIGGGVMICAACEKVASWMMEPPPVSKAILDVGASGRFESLGYVAPFAEFAYGKLLDYLFAPRARVPVSVTNQMIEEMRNSIDQSSRGRCGCYTIE